MALPHYSPNWGHVDPVRTMSGDFLLVASAGAGEARCAELDGAWGGDEDEEGPPRGGENTYAYSDGDEDDLAVGTVPPYMDHSLADPLVDNDSAQDTAMDHTIRAFEPQRTYSSGQPLRSKASFHRPPAPPASPPTVGPLESQRTYSSGQPLRTKASFHRPPAAPPPARSRSLESSPSPPRQQPLESSSLKPQRTYSSGQPLRLRTKRSFHLPPAAPPPVRRRSPSPRLVDTVDPLTLTTDNALADVPTRGRALSATGLPPADDPLEQLSRLVKTSARLVRTASEHHIMHDADDCGGLSSEEASDDDTAAATGGGVGSEGGWDSTAGCWRSSTATRKSSTRMKRTASERRMDTAARASDAALRDLNTVYFRAREKSAFAAKGGQAWEMEETGETEGEGGGREEALPERTLTAPSKLTTVATNSNLRKPLPTKGKLLRKRSARRGNAYSPSMRKAVIVNKVLQRMQNRELYASLRYARVCGVRCVRCAVCAVCGVCVCMRVCVCVCVCA